MQPFEQQLHILKYLDELDRSRAIARQLFNKNQSRLVQSSIPMLLGSGLLNMHQSGRMLDRSLIGVGSSNLLLREGFLFPSDPVTAVSRESRKIRPLALLLDQVNGSNGSSFGLPAYGTRVQQFEQQQHHPLLQLQPQSKFVTTRALHLPNATRGKSSAEVHPEYAIGRPRAFPQRFHTALMDLEKQGKWGIGIASFVPNGRAFVIHNRREFAEKVLYRYFDMTCYASFQRQLNLYHFQRIAHHDGTMIDNSDHEIMYFHEHFIRDRPDLAKTIRRDKVLRTKKRQGVHS